MRVTINLNENERQALVALAKANLRYPPEQVHYIVRQELTRRGRCAIGDAPRQLTGSLETAFSFLLEVIQDHNAPLSIRTRAALGLIDRQVRLTEVTDLLARIEALEARVL